MIDRQTVLEQMPGRDPRDEYFEHMQAEIEGQSAEAFRIDTDGKAEWACEKITQARANINRRNALAQEKIEQVERWLEQANKADQGTIDNMTSMLHPYFISLRESGALGKKKSYPLPSGTLQMRAKPIQFSRNDDEIIPWAQPQGLVEVKESPDWAEMKKRIVPMEDGSVVDKDTGEVIPGVTVAEKAGERFSVKVDAGDGGEF